MIRKFLRLEFRSRDGRRKSLKSAGSAEVPCVSGFSVFEEILLHFWGIFGVLWYLRCGSDSSTLFANIKSEFQISFSCQNVELWTIFVGGKVGSKNDLSELNQGTAECSDDEASSTVSRDESLECPICWESFNIVENVPYVLWCGHTLCKNCFLGLQWAMVKFPTLPILLPFFISCPWCNLLLFRLVYKGNLKFPQKNFFLLWMVDRRNGDSGKSSTSFCEAHRPQLSIGSSLSTGNRISRTHLDRVQHVPHLELTASPHHGQNHVQVYFSVERIQYTLRKSLAFFFHLTAKFPLVVIFLPIVLYAIPASAAILALYMLVTILFAFPSSLILYFAYPSLDWLVGEIVT